jgi:signal transduction histidine kinase
MRLGIQSKLVTTLILAGLIPLIASVGLLLDTTIQIRTQSIGDSFRAMARQKADHISNLLSTQIEFVWLISHLPQSIEFVEQFRRIPASTSEEIAEIEQSWSLETENSPRLQNVLNNPLALRWQALQSMQPRFSEVIVTDTTGRLIAATNKTSDYFQADEKWWQECMAGGRGRVFLADISWDESAMSAEGKAGLLVVSICMPIYSSISQDDRHVIGILKISVDGSWLVDQLDQVAQPAYTSSHMWLIHADGRPVPGADRTITPMPANAMQRIRETGSGWITSIEGSKNEFIGFAGVNLPNTQNLLSNVEWYVIVAAERSQALAPLRRLGWSIAGAASAIILVCFIAGFYIARREIMRPLLELSHGAQELGRGNIGFRLPEPGVKHHVFKEDELGNLAVEFNRMAEQLQQNVVHLTQADELKRQFIDVASHELRTPVTYILGIAQLGQRQDPKHAALMAKIGEKAQRLRRIVDNMFKLLQGGAYVATLEISPVDLLKLVNSVRQEAEPFLNERRQTLELKLPASLPIMYADAEQVRDILSNLLSNAIRFSPDQTKIVLEVAEREDRIEITIRDQGAGIPLAEQKNLFQPFYTSNLSTHTSGEYAYQSRGIGLGLSVVKRFVDLHKGSIEVSSSEEGTTVRVLLPMKPPSSIPDHTASP